MGIVMAGMHSHLFLIASLIELSIALDIVVIAYAFAVEAGVMTGAQHIDSEALVATARRAMNHDKGYFSCHITQIFNCHTDLTENYYLTQISRISQILSPLIRDGYKAGIQLHESEPMGNAGLDSKCSGYCSDDGCKNLQDLLNC